MGIKVEAPFRFFSTVIASMILVGIFLTGFSVVHWFLYLPVAFLYFSAVTGFCPGMMVGKMLFGRSGK